MIPRSIKKDSDLYKTELTPRDYLILCLVFICIYQTGMMWLWVTYPALDWFLLRFSLSNSDAMSIAALALSLWALYLFWKNKASLEKRVDALELINTALAKSLPPDDLRLVIQSVVEHELIPRVKRMKKIAMIRESGNKAAIEAINAAEEE